MNGLNTELLLLGISILLLWWYHGHHKRTAQSLQNQINLLNDRVSVLEGHRYDRREGTK